MQTGLHQPARPVDTSQNWLTSFHWAAAWLFIFTGSCIIFTWVYWNTTVISCALIFFSLHHNVALTSSQFFLPHFHIVNAADIIQWWWGHTVFGLRSPTSCKGFKAVCPSATVCIVTHSSLLPSEGIIIQEESKGRGDCNYNGSASLQVSAVITCSNFKRLWGLGDESKQSKAEWDSGELGTMCQTLPSNMKGWKHNPDWARLATEHTANTAARPYFPKGCLLLNSVRHSRKTMIKWSSHDFDRHDRQQQCRPTQWRQTGSRSQHWDTRFILKHAVKANTYTCSQLWPAAG